MQTGLKVLLVEDQHDIAANIWDYLERRGYTLDHAADGESGLSRALKGDLDVIVLDLGLPRLDGLELCRTLREAGHGVPVLMLTARDTLDDKLRGFAEGADDYMVKPFSMRELEARIRAVHRRSRPAGDAQLRVGELSYNPSSMLATRAGQTRALTRVQGVLLATLMRDAPNVIPHRKLIEAVWGDEGGDSAALHTHLYELRLLLDRPFAHAMIQSVRGLGYRMVPPP
ncbi:MAG: response regulator transcription factor [Lysobacter sp.]|nr:response regulator transcription factor [Lysobacter sp.]